MKATIWILSILSVILLTGVIYYMYKLKDEKDKLTTTI